MTSWNIKGTLPKSGRWFSWMESCQSFLREWWASRMVLEWYLGPNTPNPDDNLVGKFVELRSGRGGLKLCHIILSTHYWENCHILLTCNRPLWDAYTVYRTGDHMQVGIACGRIRFSNEHSMACGRSIQKAGSNLDMR